MPVHPNRPRLPGLAAATLTGLLTTPCPTQDTGPFPWHSDLDAARAVAATEHKPLLVVFRCER